MIHSPEFLWEKQIVFLRNWKWQEKYDKNSSPVVSTVTTAVCIQQPSITVGPVIQDMQLPSPTFEQHPYSTYSYNHPKVVWRLSSAQLRAKQYISLTSL
jgi:hypothetical protein